MYRIYKLIPIVLFLYSFNLVALVDYTEHEFVKPPETGGGVNIKQVETRAPRPVTGSNQKNFISAFSLGSTLETQKVDLADQTKKVEKNHFNFFVQSDFNVFININYWMMKSNSELLASNSSRQNGNPTFKIGFNWLRLGGPSDLALIDLFGGMMLKGNSDFASTRNDQLVGLETMKRFNNFVFGLGYEYRITGDPQTNEESSIGNINKFQVALGWKVSNDINLSLEGNYIKFAGNELSFKESLMHKGFTYGYVTPKMSLSLSKWVLLDLGGNFRTQKVSVDESLLKARLWDMQGLHGNSIFAGLNIIL